ncbi:hypothetical protein MLD38_014382 [Melastoma candidum]|uniref:Uncharacterized protein n=1 Tax=Melastoma candidum TaxID=119954 RepID=A0ACB9RDS4_9MYRT|nr:hypothetical protein MLD38_014382 [Melastoma candidum]
MELSQSRAYSCASTTENLRSREDYEEALKWASLERLPTHNRVRRGILHGVTGDLKEIDIRELSVEERKKLVDRLVRNVDNNEEFLLKLKERIDRVGIELPTIEVRFKNLRVGAVAYVGKSALPTVFNFFVNLVQDAASFLHVIPSKKRRFSVLHDVSGIIRPGRLTLLLGPPGSGKTTLLRTLSGNLPSQLKASGDVTYNGHAMHEFVVGRTSAYISEHDVHMPLLTVRETLVFSAKCQGVGSNYDMLMELLRREKLQNIKPDPYIDALMKASVLKGQEDVVTDYILKILGLEGCADTIVGNNMIRGISGGQKRRVTAGEVLVGPVNALFMDSISTGLDSSTTFQIVNSIRQSNHIFSKTTLISLLQPPPETYELFDDVILLSEGQIVYQGPREHILEFFEWMGFRCPGTKAVADFLQEVTSRKDQRQFWDKEEQHYQYISASEFAEAFMSFHVGMAMEQDLQRPFEKSKSHPAALTKREYSASKKDLFKACLSREAALIRRSLVFQITKVFEVTFCSAVLATVFAKQRDMHFYPSWAFTLPSAIVNIPTEIVEVCAAMAITYYALGFDPSPNRIVVQFLILTLHGQAFTAFYRCMATITRDHTKANTVANFCLLWLFIFGGFIVSRDNMKEWLRWAFYTSPMMFTQTAILTNEFCGSTWDHAFEGTNKTAGIAALESRGFPSDPSWDWIGLCGLIGFIVLYDVVAILALTYLNQPGTSRAIISESKTFTSDEMEEHDGSRSLQESDSIRRGRQTFLPFIPLSITFENIKFSVDVPKELKNQLDDRLVLLKGISGWFRPGVLTAMMGVSGAGKTTLLDVLAGRKNTGYIEGSIRVSGHLKNQATFAHVSGYCEQTDIHTPFLTVYESLAYSAWLRLPRDVDPRTRELFIEEGYGSD